MPADLIPWVAFLPAAIATVFRRRREPARDRAIVAARTMALFTLFSLILFSGSSGKRGVYMMGAFPALSLLIAAAVVEFGLGALGFALMAVLGVILGVAAPLALVSGAVPLPAELARASGLAGGVAMCVAGLSLAAGAVHGVLSLRRGRREAALASAIGGALVAFFLAGTVGGAVWSRMQSAVPFCARMDAAAPKGERIAVDNAKFEQFMFYTLRKTAMYNDDGELSAILAAGRARYAILLRDRYERLRRQPPVEGLSVLAEGRINRHEYVLVGPER
jgi:4-amino-4-deoxy-L-arabinose transferase-like glycosyltransferase